MHNLIINIVKDFITTHEEKNDFLSELLKTNLNARNLGFNARNILTDITRLVMQSNLISIKHDLP